MIISTQHFIINAITTAEVSEHLVPNLRNLKIINYVVQILRGGEPGKEENEVVKIQMLCPRSEYLNVLSYLREHYIQRYGVVCYFEQVNVLTQ